MNFPNSPKKKSKRSDEKQNALLWNRKLVFPVDSEEVTLNEMFSPRTDRTLEESKDLYLERVKGGLHKRTKSEINA